MSDYAVSKPIFDFKATEYKTKIATHILYGSGKISLSFGSLAASASPKSSGGGFGEWMIIFNSHLRARQANIL